MKANGCSALLLSWSLRIPLLGACMYPISVDLRLSMALLTRLLGTLLFLDSHLPTGFRL
jgi:hypothetical protein